MQVAARAPVAVAVTIALLVGATGCSRDERVAGGSTLPETSPSPAPPIIKQANWKFETFKTAATKSLRKRDLARFRAQRARIKKLVREVYDTLFLAPGEKKSVVAEKFTARAARSLLGSGAGMPEVAARIKTLVRRARIGIQPTALKRAAATVSIRARAFIDGKKLRIVHHSTLWLERSHNRWTAIAFDIDQGRVR